MGDCEVDQLRQEVVRLTVELDRTSAEKEQAAQYGLVLLEEKDSLELRCQDLENLYENTRQDLLVTQEALAKFQSSQQVSTRTGIEHEETLLSESAARETSLNSQIIEIELDLKAAKAEVERLKTEKGGALAELAGSKQQNSLLELELKAARGEVKEYRFRETRLLTDYSELEEENVALQKQVSSLRSTTVEFEGAKHEIRHLQEEVDLLNSQVEELTNLKKIAEKQLEEALESLQAEREQRYALKKELDAKNNSESMFQLGNLALSIQGMPESGAPSSMGSEGDEEAPVFKKMDDTEDTADEQEDPMAGDESAPAEDLFSEIHLGQLKRLEKQLESSETEKQKLCTSAKEVQEALEAARREVVVQRARVAELLAHCAQLDRLTADEDSRLCSQAVANNIKDISGQLSRHQAWQAKAVRELDQLKQNLRHFAIDDEATFDTVGRLKTELAGLRDQLQAQDRAVADLGHDIKIMESLAVEAQSALGSVQNELTGVTEELAKIYHHICTANNITPSRVMLEHSRGSEDRNASIKSADAFTPSKMELLRAKLKTVQLLRESAQFGDSAAVTTSLETVKDQLKYLKAAVESSLEITKKKISNSNAAAVAAAAAGILDHEAVVAEADLQEAQEQIVKLKSLLSTKREQIATLRTVLKANKQTAEFALSTLKAKYDSEKGIVSETMLKLRNELRLLKEDAATFSSLRAMFAARCEEYSTQVDELQRQVLSAEDEKKTLNQLLRMAIHQKLVLTQRLEEIEMQSELRPSTGGPRRGGPRKPSAGYSRGGRSAYNFQTNR